MKKYRITIFIIALSFLCTFFWDPMQVEAASGSYAYNDVIHSWADVNEYVYLDNVYYGAFDITSDSSEIIPDNGSVVYKGSYNRHIQFNTEKNSYINGTYYTYIEFSAANATGFDIQNIEADISASNLPEGVVLNSYAVSNNITTFRLCLYFIFYNVESTSLGVRMPLNIDITLVADYDNSLADIVSVRYPVKVDVDPQESYNYLTYDNDLQNLFGADSYIANQNQQIIDGIDENTGVLEDLINNLSNWFTEQKTNINTRFSELTSNLSSWFSGVQTTLSNFFTPYFDNITEAFKKALSDTQATDNEVLSGAMDDYQAAEEEVFNPAMDSLSEFDFGSNDINSLGIGFVAAITFLSSCMSNLYSLTPFAAVFDVIATLGLASICIGLSRLWFGKKG